VKRFIVEEVEAGIKYSKGSELKRRNVGSTGVREKILDFVNKYI